MKSTSSPTLMSLPHWTTKSNWRQFIYFEQIIYFSRRRKFAFSNIKFLGMIRNSPNYPILSRTNSWNFNEPWKFKFKICIQNQRLFKVTSSISPGVVHLHILKRKSLIFWEFLEIALTTQKFQGQFLWTSMNRENSNSKFAYKAKVKAKGLEWANEQGPIHVYKRIPISHRYLFPCHLFLYLLD